MIVAGIDQSTKTGLVLLEDSINGVLFHDELTGPTRFDHSIDRALSISDQVLGPITAHKPDLVVFEGYGYASQSLAVSVEIGTILRLVARRMGIAFVEIPPNVLKKYLTGKGNANKEAMMLSVYKRFGFEAYTNNVGDAFALASAGLCILGADVPVPASQVDYLRSSVDLPKGYKMH